MAFTYDLSTSIGKVRKLIPDRDEVNAVFQDDEIQDYLTENSDSVRRAAAEALETIATDQTLVLKVIKTLDLSTDGAAMMDALLKRASLLRTAADRAEAEDEALFDFAEMGVTEFQKREIVYKKAQRSL